jgi:capsular polysaccharide biosynthesis protein
MKVFVPHSAPTFHAAAHWNRCEALIRDCLLELGHEVVRHEYCSAPGAEEDRPSLRIYAHASRRERPDGDLFLKEMHLPGLFTLDPQGWGVEHSRMQRRPDFDTLDPGEAAARVAALRDAFLSSGESRLPQPEAAVPPEDPGFILVPLQRPHDYVIDAHSPLSVRDFIDTVAGWAARTGRTVALKLHPANDLDPEIVAAARGWTARSPHVRLVAGNIHRLLAAARGVFVINSGSGFEGLLHGRPVATFGDCDYRWVTFRATPSTLDEAAGYVDAYTEEQRLEAYRFVDFYCWRHAYGVQGELLAGSRARLLAFLAATLDEIARRPRERTLHER